MKYQALIPTPSLVRGLAVMSASIMLFTVGCAGTVDDSSAVENDEAVGAMSVEGAILDGSGNPLSGVVVILGGAANRTAATTTDGTYTFRGLAAGSYTVRTAGEGRCALPAKTVSVPLWARRTIQNFVLAGCSDMGDGGPGKGVRDPDPYHRRHLADGAADARSNDAGVDAAMDSIAADGGIHAPDACPRDAAPGTADAPNDVCVPVDECSPDQTCGTIVGNCGQTVDCGTCTGGTVCGSDNACHCPPVDCPSGANCGTVTNGCGSTASCGSCTPPESCGGSGIPNVCGTNVCDTNTQQCLTSRDVSPGSCYQCAATVGCFDPALGGHSCEDLTTGAPASCQTVLASSSIPTETQVCLATLKGFFATHCAAGPQPSPCLCGTGAPDLCFDGTAAPVGPLAPIYQCDLGPSIADINNDFLSPSKGASVANAIIECAHAFSCACQF